MSINRELLAKLWYVDSMKYYIDMKKNKENYTIWQVRISLYC